jgi:hypothetical protein
MRASLTKRDDLRAGVVEICDAPRTRAVLAQCAGERAVIEMAFRCSVVDWLLAGGKEEKKVMDGDAQDIQQGIRKAKKYRERLIARLQSRVITDDRGRALSLVPWLTGDGIEAEAVLDAVLETMASLADDLKTPPSAMRERKDVQFLRLLGRRFSEVGIDRPKPSILCELNECVTGTAPYDDAAAIHAYSSGVMSKEK